MATEGALAGELLLKSCKNWTKIARVPTNLTDRYPGVKYPENSFKSFQAAVDAGVDIVETDLQLTKDGVIVINHDPSTGRLYDQDLVIGDTFLDDLLKLNHKEDPECGLIQFEELLKWSLDKGVKLMLDIKPVNSKVIYGKIIRSLLNVHNSHKFWYDKIIFGLWSLDAYIYAVATGLLRHFEIIIISISPKVCAACIAYSESLAGPDKYSKLSAVSLLYISSWEASFEGFRKLLATKNLKLYLWTVNSPRDIFKSLDLKADGIITDFPERVKQLSKSLETLPFETGDLPYLSKEYLKESIYFGLFKVFEFTVTNNLHSNYFVRRLLTFSARLLVNNR